MDFNDIQNAWNNDNSDTVVLPDNLEKIKTANMPVERIRKNLRNELFGQILALVIIGLLPLDSEFPAKMKVPYYFIFGIMIAISIYYLGQLFLFYKRLNNVALSTKDSLYETYYDVRLNMQLYKTYTFVLAPFLLTYFIGYILYKDPDAIKILNGNLESQKLLLYIGVFVATILAIGLLTEFWVQHFYGKYAKEIRKVIDELKE
ncbi:hypothetical protein EV144_102831 [Flavobacterium sp. 270]|uniref:hypothetical protein n=1 Tax=Flavobacterium sp. 270 TaxID=2512114 RepID=UPI0010657B02|nr:hypothetical protein [Flavobacterium sp. 270]TDW50392.1 hypothetical protein EV144_102831 [Flavobacterium sp. 270]